MGADTSGNQKDWHSKRKTLCLMDAIQAPMSLNKEPVYNDGGDALYVMDQISDKNKEEN